MIGKKVNSSDYVSLYKVKDILKERLSQNEKGIEPTYEQNLAKDYVKKFSKLTPAKSRKLSEELKKLDYLDEKTAVKIADLIPSDEDILNLVLSKDSNIDEVKNKEILEIIKKYSK